MFKAVIFRTFSDGNERRRDPFIEQLRSTYRITDRFFAVLLPLEWIAAIALSIGIVSKKTASGPFSQHLLIALFAGAAFAALPLVLIKLLPGRAVTRHVVALSQLLMAGLFSYLTDGWIEDVFLTLGSLAMLSFYRDWKLLIPATLIAIFDDMLDTWAAPIVSVSGYFSPETWSWFEHLGWLFLTNVFLIVSIHLSLREMKEIARRAAELEESEERYRAVVEQATDGIALFDPETLRVVECNKAFSDLLGCADVEEAKKLKAADFSTASGKELEQLITHLRRTGTLRSGERTYRRCDGELLTVEAMGNMINYGGRSVVYGSFKNIEIRKKAESELRRLALVAQKTQNSVIVSDTSGRIQWVNEGFQRVTGYEVDEVIGRRPAELLCGDATDPDTLTDIYAAVAALTPFDGEIYNYKKSGEGYWASISLTPIWDENNVLQGFISIEMDLTERKKMENDLRRAYEDLEQRVFERTADLLKANQDMRLQVREREKAEIEVRNAREFLKKVVDNVPTLIAVRDSESRFTLANRAFAKKLGSTAEEIIGKTPYEFYKNPEELARILEGDRYVFETRQEKPMFEETYTDLDGEPHYLETVKRPLIGDNGEANILIISNDQTDRRNLESQLRHAQKLESIGQLAAGIAHEINTPTQYVSDNTRFLQDAFADIRSVLNKYGEMSESMEKADPSSPLISDMKDELTKRDLGYLLEEVPNAISQSLDGVSRIAKIVQSMKDFAHPGATEKTAVDLNKAIESTITVARNEWKYVAELETKFDTRLPMIPCLIGELNQVVLNMLINAAHAIGDVVGDGTCGKGKITISTTRASDEWVEVRISDTGSGIPAKIQERIFDPFFTTKEIGKGSGQGLAISHSVVVDKHSGRLTFETQEGKGTTFIIGLPLAPVEKSELAVN
jgi:PAS domain S-box-containing protein